MSSPHVQARKCPSIQLATALEQRAVGVCGTRYSDASLRVPKPSVSRPLRRGSPARVSTDKSTDSYLA